MAPQQASKLRVLSTQVIKPDPHSESEQTVINLTPSDLVFLHLEYNQHGLLYRKPDTQQVSIDDIIHDLKQSLRKTLHFFPPLAGRLATTTPTEDSSTICYFIDCNGAGVDFIHATLDHEANLTLADIDPEAYNSLFPMTGFRNHDGVTHPLLTVQVTELVDGLFLAWSCNHSIVDGTSFWHFFNTWVEISRAKSTNEDFNSISKPPLLNRDGLNLDLLGYRSINIDSKLLTLGADVTLPDLDERVFRLTNDSVAKLKARANGEVEFSNGKISSLQAITAHIWRSLIRCRVAMDPNIRKTTFEIPIGTRNRVSPPLPEEYFGNAVLPGIVTLEAENILENGLGWTAWQINRMVASSNEPEQVKDFFVGWAKNPVFMRFDGLQGNHFILLNSPKFDVYGNDFGWGEPVAMRTGKANRFDGRLTVSNGAEKGSVEIEACLSPETMHALREDVEFMEFIDM